MFLKPAQTGHQVRTGNSFPIVRQHLHLPKKFACQTNVKKARNDPLRIHCVWLGMGCQALLPQAAEDLAKKTKSPQRSNHEIKGSREKIRMILGFT